MILMKLYSFLFVGVICGGARPGTNIIPVYRYMFSRTKRIVYKQIKTKINEMEFRPGWMHEQIHLNMDEFVIRISTHHYCSGIWSIIDNPLIIHRAF